MRRVAVGRVQVVPAVSGPALPLGVGGRGGAGVLAVEEGLFAAGVGTLLQGGEAVRRVRLGDVGQRHGRLRLRVRVGVSGHHIVSALYLDDVAVRRPQQVLGVSGELSHQAWTPRAADLLRGADGLLRGRGLQPLFGFHVGDLGFWGVADQLWGYKKVWDLVRGEDVAVGRRDAFLVAVLALTQHAGLHRAADLIQNPHGPTRQWEVWALRSRCSQVCLQLITQRGGGV